MERLFELSKLASRKTSDTSEYFVFFDEIQYYKDWEIHLKSLVDTYRSTKFVASGSAAAALRLKSTESGAGRFTDFSLPPLTFHEYIHLKGLNLVTPFPDTFEGHAYTSYTSPSINGLNEEFIRYLNFGGYPEGGH